MCGCFLSHDKASSQIIWLQHICIRKQQKLAEGAYGDVWKCKKVINDGSKNEVRKNTSMNEKFEENLMYALKEIKLQTKQLIEMYSKQQRILVRSNYYVYLYRNQQSSITQQHQFACNYQMSLKVQQISSKGTPYDVGCLLFQFGSITLLDEFHSKQFTQQQIIDVLIEICLSVEELHGIGIYHLDIKPQNIILVGGRYKMCDFGSAIEHEIRFSELTRTQRNKWLQYIESNSTLMYRSPEMIDPTNQVINHQSDIWMIGCIAYLLTFQKHPFQNQGKLAIISSNLQYPKPGFLTDLITKMLNIHPPARPSAKALRLELQSWKKVNAQ